MAIFWLRQYQWGHVQDFAQIVKCGDVPDWALSLPLSPAYADYSTRAVQISVRLRGGCCNGPLSRYASARWQCSWHGSRECRAHSRSRPCHGVRVAVMEKGHGWLGPLDVWACSQNLQKQTSHLSVALYVHPGNNRGWSGVWWWLATYVCYLALSDVLVMSGKSVG